MPAQALPRRPTRHRTNLDPELLKLDTGPTRRAETASRHRRTPPAVPGGAARRG